MSLKSDHFRTFFSKKVRFWNKVQKIGPFGNTGGVNCGGDGVGSARWLLFICSLPRSCGRLFCSECSEQSVPIPAEQLYQPVRVCDQCYTSLTTSPPVIASCDIKHSPAAAARDDTINTSEDKTVEKELEERLNLTTPDLTSAQLEMKDHKPDAGKCNTEVEINKNNSGVEVEVN